MQAQIKTVKGFEMNTDIHDTIKWGGQFPLDIAAALIDKHGVWIKPDKLDWRPRKETNSPLRLKLKLK